MLAEKVQAAPRKLVIKGLNRALLWTGLRGHVALSAALHGQQQPQRLPLWPRECWRGL